MLISISTNIFGYRIEFDRHGFHLHPSDVTGKNIIILGVDMSWSTKLDNRKKDILILGKGPAQGLEYTLSAKKMYSINFTEHNKKFCLSWHYNGANTYLFVSGTGVYEIKAKDSEIFEEDGQSYPQIYLDECLYEL